MIYLAGDIGGTTSRFQWWDSENADFAPIVSCYSSASFSSFVELLETLLNDQKLAHVDYACFGLPGPVVDREVTLTNLPWSISACELEAKLPLSQVRLDNDFQAAALGLELLQEHDTICLHRGDYDASGNRLVIGAGTGLGVAPIYQLAGHFYPQPSEGGHMDFAPVNVEQEQLLQWFHGTLGRVTYEHLLSGAGLENIYQFCMKREDSALQREDIPYLSASQVHARAEAGDKVAIAAIKIFVNIYGEFVGNAALLWPARGGIYLAGGIGLKLVKWMAGDDFTAFFLDKDNMRAVVEKMPVYLVLDPLLGLKGAFLCARRMALIRL